MGFFSKKGPTDLEYLDPAPGWNADYPAGLPKIPITLRLDLPDCGVRTTTDVWVKQAPQYWASIARGEGSDIALYNASALIAALIYYNHFCEGGGDKVLLGHLLYQPHRRLAHVITKLQQLPDDIAARTAIHILQELLKPDNKYYIGVAHVMWVRWQRLAGMDPDNGWASDLPVNFAEDYQDEPRRRN